MNFDFTNCVGPFSMGTPPVRKGVYVIEVLPDLLPNNNDGEFEMWRWSGDGWQDDDESGLGSDKDASAALSWYGQREPCTTTSVALNDGLE